MKEEGKNMEHCIDKKIRFDEVGLQGREVETSKLEGSFQRILSSDNCTQELVFLSGEAGTGKTALAHWLKDKVRQTGRFGGVLATGKHDLNLNGQPFLAISSTCTEICREVINLKKIAPSTF